MSSSDAHNSGKIVLISGAGGYIGSALAHRLIESGVKLVLLLDHSEQNLYDIHSELNASGHSSVHVPLLGDISDKALLDEIFEKYRPDAIFHAAAFKHVPLMEAHPVAVIRNNVLGTWTLANAALQHRVRQLVMISTDKAVNPHSVMGAAKRVAELVLLRLSNAETRMSALRLGNVLGSNGSVVPLFQRQIASGGPVTVTHPDSRRFFLSLRNTIDLVLAASTLNQDAAVLIPELGTPVKILDLANKLIRDAGPGAAATQIIFTGLRPGDKLTEELISASEWLEAINDPALKKINGPQPLSKSLDSTIHAISEGARTRNRVTLIEALCSVVPEYQPSDTLLSLLTANSL